MALCFFLCDTAAEFVEGSAAAQASTGSMGHVLQRARRPESAVLDLLCQFLGKVIRHAEFLDDAQLGLEVISVPFFVL